MTENTKWKSAAASVVEKLLANELIELTNPDKRSALVGSLCQYLERIADAELPSEDRASEVAEWFLEQDEVGDLFITDEELSSILDGQFEAAKAS